MKAFMLCVSFLSRRSATKARGAHSSVDVDDRAALDFTSEDARGDVRHLRQRYERRGPCQLSKVEIARKPRPGFEAHRDRKSTRLTSSHSCDYRMPPSA